MKILIGKEFAPATLTRYNTACAHLSSYIKWKYEMHDFEIKDLNYEFISQFVFWLITQHGPDYLLILANMLSTNNPQNCH